MDILVATTNAGKVRDFELLLAGFDITWHSLVEFDGLEEVEENGSTFAENAAIKALGYARLTNMLTLADDSGLEIEALGGEPGINSARFSGAHKDHSCPKSLIDQENIAKVLCLLEGVPAEARGARFVCSLAIATPEKVVLSAEGYLYGEIIKEKRGENGFGYDPIFLIPSLGKTAAELCKEEKNKISHRANAVRCLAPMLERFIAD
ncbi:MAG: RdgB/HAM1 family non-canonical purine NTP pyrophosphatase [Phycisphaerae bacterium]